jgi:colanic acid/amylovoran biosynthesis glycosyltransferase
MILTYFTNRYPAVSHTFIRREIEAVEALGLIVERVALRSDPRASLVDAADLREADRTHMLLTPNKLALFGSIFLAAAATPVKSLSVLLFAIRLARRSGIHLAKMVAYWAEALLLRAQTRRTRTNLVRVHFGTNAAIVARLARRLGAPPYSIAYHGPDEFDAPERWDIQGVVAESAFVTAISSFCAAQLMRWSNQADWSRIRRVSCIVDATIFDEKAMPPRPFRLCTVARLAPQKGLPLLLDALARTALPISLDIVGDGPGREALQSRVELLGLGECVRFLGSRDGEGVRAALGNAHVFVLPSFAEGLPVVIMEALAAGRPVISSAIAGTIELVDNQCGWLVPAGDVDALVAVLKEAELCSSEQLFAMGQCGRSRILARHSAAAVSRQMTNALADYNSRSHNVVAKPCAA